MTTPPRPNFFLLLEMNPDEPWDQALYQKTIEEKVRQWSYESLGIAKKALPAQFYRGLLPQIRQVMEDPRLRAQEARSASALLVTRYQKDYQKFEDQLLLLNLKEGVDREEVDAFVKEFRHIVPARTIERRITTRIRQPSQGGEGSAGVLRVLEASVAKSIEDHLSVVQMQTLYELLHASQTQSTPLLFQAAENLYAQEVRKHPNATTTARVELAGFAMSIFKTEEMRARYDETLRRVFLQQLLQELTESAKRGRVKEIHAGQVLYYLRKAEEKGVSREEALDKLKEHGHIHQWFIVIPASDSQIQQYDSKVGESAGEDRIGGMRKPNDAPQDRRLAVDRNIWRRTRAILLVCVQLVCLLVVGRGEIDSVRPLLPWNELARVPFLIPSVPITRRVIEAQFAVSMGNTTAHIFIVMIAVFVVALIDILLCVLLMTCAIPLVFAMAGLLVGGVSALRSVVETLFMVHADAAKAAIATERGMGGWQQKQQKDFPCFADGNDATASNASRSSIRKDSVLGPGWLKERLVAENLVVALHRTGQRWFDCADLLTEWRWMRGCFIGYWAYPIMFGCQVAGLMHYIVSIELDALCTCLYTVILLLGEVTVFASGALFVTARTLYMRFHHILEP